MLEKIRRKIMKVLLYLIVSISKHYLHFFGIYHHVIWSDYLCWSSFLKSLLLFKSYKCCYPIWVARKDDKNTLLVMLAITVNCQRHFFEKTLLWAYEHLESTLSWNVKMKIRWCRRLKTRYLLWSVIQCVERECSL